ncbi:MAG: carboxypeptidase regulatory-like domain-containing protein [Gemmatimonadaceae bacterium]|nr:carboxypeptidase regulatory-like domain-containing protein [Gemmatimonadaceae bacterium]
MRPFPCSRTIRITAALASVAAAGLATPAHAQQKTTIRDRAAQETVKKPVSTAGIGVIDGIVTDTLLRPLGAADVSVVGVGARVVTEEGGRFRFLQVPAGQYLLVVRRIGFAPTSGIIDVPADDTLRLSYILARTTNLMDTVRVRETRVSMRMLGFDQRRVQGVGQFITQEQIERRGSRETSDFLRTLRGVDVSRITTEAFAGTIALSKREGGSVGGEGSGACSMQVLLDGIVLPRFFNLDLLPPPKQISGIEVYSGAATIPPQFGGPDRRCGMILVWTREGY